MTDAAAPGGVRSCWAFTVVADAALRAGTGPPCEATALTIVDSRPVSAHVAY
jgi:hypothetical protein